MDKEIGVERWVEFGGKAAPRDRMVPWTGCCHADQLLFPGKEEEVLIVKRKA
jgi:hypothetical protein